MMFKQMAIQDRFVTTAATGATRNFATSILFQPVVALVNLLLTWESRIRERDHLASLPDRLRVDAGLPKPLLMEYSQSPFWRA